MTSFELFRLLKLKKKSTFCIYFYSFFLLKYIMCDKVHHFMKKFKYFASKYDIISGIKIKLCKKSCRKEKVGGVYKSNLHKL